MQPTFYIIYKTTNLVNGKIYIGKHVTDNIDDGYLGSGSILRRAISKYGVENFQRQVLHVFDTEEEMNAKERELVTEDFVLQESNYNLNVGGTGGWSYVNRTGQNVGFAYINERGLNNSAGQNLKASNRHKELLDTDPDYRDSWKANHAKAMSSMPGTFTGRKHTEETKAKMSGPRPGVAGKNNSQFGTRWITNGQQSKKISAEAEIPEGWQAGRKMKLR